MSSAIRNANDNSLNFLAGGGEMGFLIRSHDWSSTGLGQPEGWPAPLRTAVRLILNTGHPMYIWWGPELTCFYNDAYALSIGPERHPGSLGQAGRQVWAEIWDIIGPQIDRVMSGEGATWNVNHLVPITRNGRREEVYWTYSYGPIDDEASGSGVGGVLVVCSETTEQVLAERSRAEAAERQRRLFEQAPGFIAFLDGPNHVFEFVNDAYTALFEDRNFVGRTARDAFPELEGQAFFALLDEVYRSGERYVAHGVAIQLARAEGGREERLLDFIYEPVRDDVGRIIGIFCEGHDVTGVHQAQAALQHREEQLRLATEAAEVGLWDLHLATDTLFWPPRVKAMFGISPDVPISMADFYAGLHPDDGERTAAAFAAAVDPQTRALYDVEYRAVGKEDGVVRWIAAKGRAIFDAEGSCTRVLGTAIDVTERKRSEEQLRLMVNELNHRVKNSLATVQGIVVQTLRRGAVPEPVRDALASRLVALAQAHDVLTDRKWSGADLRRLAEQAAAPYAGLDGSAFLIEGPDVTLPPQTAIAIALAFHELATNAAKYGALSAPGGQVRLRWTASGEDRGQRLRLEWREIGGPRVAPPAARGFGTRLIERGLAADLGGGVSLAFEPSGLVCSIDALLLPDTPVTA